jgi:hypothetical protein
MRSRHKSEAFITTQEHCSVVVAPLTKQTEHEVLPQDLSLGGQDLPVRCTNRATMHMMTALAVLMLHVVPSVLIRHKTVGLPLA